MRRAEGREAVRRNAGQLGYMDVARIIKVRGKKKKVRRVIRTTVTLGNLGSVGLAGATAVVAEVRLSNPPGKSSLKWDPRTCVAVDVGG
jgi:hypothetical protein